MSRSFVVEAEPYWFCQCGEGGAYADDDAECGYCEATINFEREPDAWRAKVGPYFDMESREWGEEAAFDCESPQFTPLDSRP